MCFLKKKKEKKYKVENSRQLINIWPPHAGPAVYTYPYIQWVVTHIHIQENRHQTIFKNCGLDIFSNSSCLPLGF